MLAPQYLLKIILWQFILSLGLGGAGQSLAIHSSPTVNQQFLPVAAAGQQWGGDQAAISALPSSERRILPLSAGNVDKKPRRNAAPDFNFASLSAKAVYVLDKESGVSLLSFKEEEARSIGSVTKLMSALVFLDTAPDWEKEVTLAAEDGVEGHLYLFEGDKVTVKDLFYVSLVGSSNNATMALVRSTGLSSEEFVGRMNEKAKFFGLSKTQFREPTGLDPENKSTARETARLLKETLADKFIQAALQTKNYSLRLRGSELRRRVPATNLLLTDQAETWKINGGKTGFVEEAGYCLAVEMENAQGRRIIVVILGAASHLSRFAEAKAVAKWVFEAYNWPEKDI